MALTDASANGLSKVIYGEDTVATGTAGQVTGLTAITDGSLSINVAGTVYSLGDISIARTGEERIGKLVQQLMSNEKFVTGVQTIVGRALSAKGSVDKSIRTALSAMNLPSTGDLETVREKIEELEKVLGQVEDKIDALMQANKK